jgi:Helix-turn-helix domain
VTKPKTWDPDWITRHEAQAILEIGFQRLTRLIQEGHLTRADRASRRYSRRQVEALATERATWLTVRDVAALLGVSRGRVDQLARADLIPYETDSRGQRRYRKSQIEVVANARLARWHDGLLTAHGER